ncbi:MAG: phosphoglycerate kinase [Bacteroidaceae bacterium]|jgi:phosphoglycerate kinase|nr:phosphoglycerate kinase [Bacteroidaceae bacterium]MBO5952129.1 phosphoglycerate kinase [Bacteroidaceae bacterium]
MTTIDNFNFAGKKAFVRVDFNVPLDENFNITDDTRIRAAMPTLKKIIADGGRLIIASHMGRPKKNPDPKYSLKHILAHVSEKLGVEVKFADDCLKAQDAVAALKDGEALLLENVRFYAEEEGKPRGIEKDDPAYDAAKKELKAAQKEFAKTLAAYADVYVNDAFGTAHRKHGTTAVIADYFDADHKMFGYLMSKEVNAVDKVMNSIVRPFTAIMGGSKVSTKIDIIENLLTKVDNLILCGGMTYTFKKAMGGTIGMSLCEDDKLELALDIMKKAKENNVNLLLAIDSVVADDFSPNANTQIVASDQIPDGWEGLDIGPKTIELFKEAIVNSKTILWNGPCGVFEMDKFAVGSKAIAEAICEATKNGAYSLIGGGDSVACINKFGLADQVSYVSTGGGALLEAIEGKVLPGIAAVQG